MTNKTKILFLCQEMAPYLELTEISKITRHLPQAMQENGYEIRVLMPRFGCINERRNKLHEVIRLSGMNIVVDENDNPLINKVASIQGAKMKRSEERRGGKEGVSTCRSRWLLKPIKKKQTYT